MEYGEHQEEEPLEYVVVIKYDGGKSFIALVREYNAYAAARKVATEKLSISEFDAIEEIRSHRLRALPRVAGLVREVTGHSHGEGSGAR